jgi:hypothetical protein
MTNIVRVSDMGKGVLIGKTEGVLMKDDMKKMMIRAKIKTSWRNSLKMSKGRSESGPHKDLKYYLAKTCSELGLDYHTEAVFNDNSRCDFLIEDFGLIIEVLHSETKKEFEKKKTKYPFPVLTLRTGISQEDVYSIMLELCGLNGDASWFIKRHGGKLFK